MKLQNLSSANASGYRAPELYQLGNIDKVQRYTLGYYYDWLFWLCYKYCWF